MALTEYDVQPMLHRDGANLVRQMAISATYQNAEAMGLKTQLEKDLAVQYIGARNGKVFATKIWHYATNTSSAGERMRDSVDLSCTPATDTTAGRDDFADASEIFTWKRCNYTRDDDGTARPTALYGSPNYRTSGAVDIGNVYPTFWYTVESHGTYDIYYMSDSPHPELGLVPWVEAVKADGTVLPFYVHSAFYSISNEEGTSSASKKILRSQYGTPAYNQSYNGMITDYQKKGAGYWGAGSERTLFAYLMLVIKYATKNSQKVFAGCTSFDTQVKAAVAESGVKRVLLTDASGFYPGCCVSISKTGLSSAPDRGSGDCHTTADRVKVVSITTVSVSGTSYSALNLDLADGITVDTTMYVSTMPCFSGETDAVIGHYDGSYLSNTDGKHVFRIGGTEYSNGQAIIDSNVVMQRDDASGLWLQYIAPRGVKHVANAHTGYALASGGIPINSGDYWSGDVSVDTATGSFNPSSIGGGDSIGTGDYVWGSQSGANGALREKYTVGYLRYGSHAGLGNVICRSDLSGAVWHSGGCD